MSCSTRCSVAGRWCLAQGEKRRLRISFAKYKELETEDLAGLPVVQIDAASGVVISDAAVVGKGVDFWADLAGAVVKDADKVENGGRGYTDWLVFTFVATTGGAQLLRQAYLRVEEVA